VGTLSALGKGYWPSNTRITNLKLKQKLNLNLRKKLGTLSALGEGVLDLNSRISNASSRVAPLIRLSKGTAGFRLQRWFRV
jgi:hypothetical protein